MISVEDIKKIISSRYAEPIFEEKDGRLVVIIGDYVASAIITDGMVSRHAFRDILED